MLKQMRRPRLALKPPTPQAPARPMRIRRPAGAPAALIAGIPSPPSVRQGIQSPGHPLDNQTRGLMEARFGTDLGQVRIHSGDAAERSADALQASAFTVGHDVVFGAGRYRPNEGEGQRLLAHELAHVVQQSPETAAEHPRGSAGRLESEAHDVAARVVARREVDAHALSASSVGLQREDEDRRTVEAKHRERQRWVYNMIQPDTIWDRARRGEPNPNSLTPEQQAKDPHVLFNKSVKWIHSGWVKLTVLSRVPGAKENATLVKVFDPTVNYPQVGGSIDSTLDWEASVPAKTDRGERHIQLVAEPGLTEMRLRELIRHEMQHVAGYFEGAWEMEKPAFEKESKGKPMQAAWHLNRWLKYEDEFRGYWLESIARPGAQYFVDAHGRPVMTGGSGGVDRWGSEDKPGGELTVKADEYTKPFTSWPLFVPQATIRLQNEKQTKIANHIIHNYMGMAGAFLSSPLFRQKVQNLDKPKGMNLVNSLAIDRLRSAIDGPATRKSLPWGALRTRGQDVESAVRWLDAADRAFLRSTAAQPFWDHARSKLSTRVFDWLEGNIKAGKQEPLETSNPANQNPE